MADPYYAYTAPTADREALDFLTPEREEKKKKRVATVSLGINRGITSRWVGAFVVFSLQTLLELTASFPGYLSSETPSLASHHAFGYGDLRAFPSDALQKDVNPVRPGTYGVDHILGNGIRPEPGTGRLAAGTSLNGYSSSLEDPVLHQRPDFSAGISPIISATERPSSLRNVDSLAAPARDSNILFVHGLPTDCTRREVGHLFRPFYGFKEIRVIHKEARRSGDRALVLCFVEFVDSQCAFTAMEALQGYQFDDKKPDSPVLRIQFAHFPLHLPSDK